MDFLIRAFPKLVVVVGCYWAQHLIVSRDIHLAVASLMLFILLTKDMK